jgi:hypothetical protein
MGYILLKDSPVPPLIITVPFLTNSQSHFEETIHKNKSAHDHHISYLFASFSTLGDF